ncbi:hypothetical protein [Vulcanisaeta sp. JCM 16159]|uniref:hypothetical protein n=1 Tax=Vulcanisaeta sp. JCM 16159 TaxID=1295371 RepID=UPI0006D22F03|nr:hypothetical protein [Vulcanisaeta sp. JCM 16159]
MLIAYTDASVHEGLAEICWRVEWGGTVISAGSRVLGIDYDSLYAEGMALVHVLDILKAMGIRGEVLVWITDAKVIIDILNGRVRPSKPAMQFVVLNITWKAHELGIRIEPKYSNALDC